MAYDKEKKAKADAARWLRIKEEMSSKRKLQRLANKPMIRNGDPSREELRRCIEQGYCWWCQRGGWKRLGQHTAMAHQIYARDIRKMAVLLRATPTCTEEESEILSERRLELLQQGRVKIPDWRLGLGVTHEYTEAGLASMREHQRRMIESLWPDRRTEIAQKRARVLRKPHPCLVCGTIIPQAKPVCCSEECRNQALKAVGRRVGLSLPHEHFVHMGEIIKQKYSKAHPCPICGKSIPRSRPKYCSRECALIATQAKLPLDSIKARYLAGESSVEIAKTYGYCDHTIRRHLRKIGVAIRPDSSGRYNN